MVRALGYAISMAYFGVGMGLAMATYADTVQGLYPWADHIPAMCMLVGSLAGALNALGFALCFGTRYREG